MKKGLLMGTALVAMTCATAAWAVGDKAIPDDSLGLSKESVFATPTPPAFDFKEPAVGSATGRAARAYPGAPPMIPHAIEGMLPITRDTNMCKDCHVQPDVVGKKVQAGTPVPAPVSHYADLKKGELYMGRWNCVQCHRPQADVKPLVENLFGQRGRHGK